MPIVRAVAFTIVTTLSCTGQAQPIPVAGTPIAVGQGKPYDLVANCLMRQMAGRQFAAWPLVYAPPRQEALVNLWIRGREHENPIGVFHVVQNADGTTQVSFRGSQDQPGLSPDVIAAAARRCTR